jgi:hypothetical protein
MLSHANAACALLVIPGATATLLLLRLLLLLPPGDVVYLRLASPISADARRLLIAQLEKDIRPAESANTKAQRALAGAGSSATGVTAMNRQLQQAKQALQKVCGRLC